jgi:hypothetical protein
MVGERNRKYIVSIVLGIFLGIFLTAGFVSATPTVTTDKADYAPGEIVTVTGTGFLPGMDYDVPIIRPDGSIITGDGTDTPGWDTVTADSNGDFTYLYDLNGIFGLYTVEVTVEVYLSPWNGPDSGDELVASTTFTDAPKPGIDLEQCQSGALYPDGDCIAQPNPDGWKTGLNHGPFARGDSIPYRTLFKNMVADGRIYSLAIEYDTTKAFEHAIGYTTTFDRTLTNTEACSDHASPGTCADVDTEPIPVDPTVTAGFDGILGTGDDITQVPGVFTLYGGTITSITLTGGDFTGTGSIGDPYVYDVDGQREITVVFTADVAGDMVLAWGGHIERNDDWNDMANPQGSPYHMRLNTFSCPVDGSEPCSAGQQDMALTETAIVDGTLTVFKEVINDNGGTAVASDFSIHVKDSGNVDVPGSPAAGSDTTGTLYILPGGDYVVSEDLPPAGYTQVGFSGDCDSVTGAVTVEAGVDKTWMILRRRSNYGKLW